MTDQEINEAIAEACGWKTGYTERSGYHVVDPNGFRRGWSRLKDVALTALPNYCNDLNAMHEAEECLVGEKFINGCQAIDVYQCALSNICGGKFWKYCHATARQKAEAFLRTFGLWRAV